MSVDLMRLCWRVEWPTPALAAVAVKLADFANDEGENVYPSVGLIERQTRLGSSTVHRALTALEQAGVLEVVAQVHGNKWNRSTTIRRFNVARLHDLSAVEVKRGGRVILAPSTHVFCTKEESVPPTVRELTVPCAYGLQTIRIEPAAKEKNKPRTEPRKIDVSYIVLRTSEHKSDYEHTEEEKTPPIPQRDTHPSQGGIPPYPTAGYPLSQSGIPPYPTAGYNPSKEPSVEETPTPQAGGEGEAPHLNDEEPAEGSPANATDIASSEGAGFPSGSRRTVEHDDLTGQGWARGWSRESRELIATNRANNVLGHVATHLVDRVRGTLRPQKGADPAAYVRQLFGRLRSYEADVLARVAQNLADTRKEYLPDAGTIERQAREMAATVQRELEAKARRARLAAVPGLATRYPSLVQHLQTALGADVFHGWFRSMDVVALGADARLVVSVDAPFLRTYIQSHFEQQLLAAAQHAFGAVTSVEIRISNPSSGAAA